MFGKIKDKRILVVVAHPDDELLGLGATINKLTKERNCVARAVILGEGLTSRSENRNTDLWSTELKIHRDNIETATTIVGYDSVGIYNFPDNRFDTAALLDIIKIVEKEKLSFKPDIIFTHHGGDVNIDHQRTFDAVMTATRPLKEEKVTGIIAFETPSGTEWIDSANPKQFTPNYFVFLREENILAKIKGMESYEFERRDYPHPRSPQALYIRSQYWGIVNGSYFAEAFRIVRAIDA
jgi:N-acetylglucosamine malate deacetylase 1